MTTAWRRLLHRLASRLPTRVISAETSAYDALQGAAPLFERSHVVTLGPVTVYLHHYLRSDPDRGPHDHPWPWMVAIPLAGGYDEQRAVALTPTGVPVLRMFRRRPFLPYTLGGRDFHRVVCRQARDGSTTTSWSLFIHGPNTKGWGFLRSEPARSGLELGYRGVYTPHVEPDGSHTSWWRTAPKGRFMRRAAP